MSEPRFGIWALVGSYDEVAARIAAFPRAGIELFMLQFQPFEAEMRRFARGILPLAGRQFVAAAQCGLPVAAGHTSP